MFRSEDTSIPETQAEVISVTDSSPAPDAPPTTPLEPIAEVESTHHGDAEEVPADVQQYFHMEDEAEEPAPEGEGEAPAPVVDETVSNVEVEAPAEAPAEAPMDAPAALPGADALPADAPVSPSAVPAVAPDGTPLTPAATPIADVPTAAPIAPQPETDVAPMVPQVGEDGAPAPIKHRWKHRLLQRKNPLRLNRLSSALASNRKMKENPSVWWKLPNRACRLKRKPTKKAKPSPTSRNPSLL